jgi:hypothetical protein
MRAMVFHMVGLWWRIERRGFTLRRVRLILQAREDFFMPVSDLTLVRNIRQVTGDFIVEARWPYGNASPFGEVICRDLKEGFDLITRTAIIEGAKNG